eukprot:763005-Hanusia_phi.AAC.6
MGEGITCRRGLGSSRPPFEASPALPPAPISHEELHPPTKQGSTSVRASARDVERAKAMGRATDLINFLLWLSGEED